MFAFANWKFYSIMKNSKYTQENQINERKQKWKSKARNA